MSKIEELIKRLCPDGVEYRTLDKVCSVNTGTQLNKEKLVDCAEYPVINGGITPSGYWHEYNAEKNTITISQGGASAGYVNYMETPFWAGAHCYVVKLENQEVDYRYLYHYIKSIEKSLQQCQQGAGIPSVSRKTIYENRIPVPPLEVQCEIVRILDNFTLLSEELSAELSAELKARQKQYEYYENKLFDFEENKIEYKNVNFEEIATFSQGIQVDVNKQYYEPFENSVQFLRIVDFVNNYEPPRYIEKPSEKYIKQENEMVMIRYGASAAGKVFINKCGAIANNMFKINLKENIDISLKYLMYYLSQNKIYKLLNSSGKSTMPAINFVFLGKLCIEFPNIEEQERIVNILERFEMLCNDISHGLPAEIEARKKQYEYYRDKLLTFKELKKEV